MRASAGRGALAFEEHRILARSATRKSIVLLKNERNALPLDATKVRSIAVIGPYADRVLLELV